MDQLTAGAGSQGSPALHHKGIQDMCHWGTGGMSTVKL